MDVKPAAEQIDEIIKEYGGWKGEVLSRVRAVIRQADPIVVEEVKWKMRSRPEGVPAWSHEGIMCIVETFTSHMTLLFFKGAELPDPRKLFNARLKSERDRGIQFREGDSVDEAALKELVVEAVKLNEATARKR